ncbi:xanthine dehydrogenase family protein molybdopterin-binding subunit [Microbaculum marinisediminis]|uniref:Molybdopterin-dependent oxidoreductase n=1 Tax=Microbaculum marinisediminis TaxID=2931392 RepID=A0AAW5R0S2_9HYPH|nr:molybdopterin cofactor-binding domain-containing protein [Microbaculum sp. A6E488]MCT8973866.1 molybdopterin-dependent oxidoreductase [Microbaculum sp. A6E488]
MAIEFRKELFADERDDNLNEIGKPTQRQDMMGHVTGRSPFYDDHLFDGLLHLRCVRSPHHHARIRSIDTSEAERMPGVKRIVLGKDVPNNLNTLLSLLDFGLDDEPLISTKKVAYKGEPVAAVIAETERQARDACAKVRVDWEVLPHVLDVEEAIKSGAPSVNETYPKNAFVYHGKYDHQKLRYGDVEAAFRTADHVVEGRYQMSPIEQAPTETCGAIAAPETNDRYVCYTSTQALFFSLGTASKLLNMPSSRLHFIGGTVGGGFGGKVDSLHEPLAILGTMLTGRPVKYMFDRVEEMQVGAPRGAERWYIKDGVMNDGRLVARQFRGYFDSGAYTRLSSYAIIKCVGHLPGPYTIPNVHADVYCVFTNRTPATAMRGFGITGVDFAIEAHMDKVAETVGMDPIELRILNAYRDGDMKAHRRLAKNTALIECCQVAAEKASWRINDTARRETSLTGGGGARGQIPNQTALDENGRVEGYAHQSYAAAGQPTDQAAPVRPAPVQPEPTQPAPQPAGVPSAPPSASTSPAPTPPAPAPAPAQPAPSQGASRAPLRFSSVSGLRRR